MAPDTIKLSLYRSGEVPTAPECWGGPMLSSQSAHEGAKVVSRTHCPSLPCQYTFPALISVMAPKHLVFLKGKPRRSSLSVEVTS